MRPFRAALGALLTIGLLRAPLTAQLAPDEQVAPESKAAPFLWRIVGQDSDSYLFGTMHLGVTLDELPNSVEQRLRSSATSS